MESYVEIRVDRIKPNPHQPRKVFDEDKLHELAVSICEHGVLQPLIVCPNGGSDSYFLIAGERRWRAAQLAGLDFVPALVRDNPGAESLEELAIIENLQREDLNPIEEAQAYRRMVDRAGNITAAAKRLGIGTHRFHSRLPLLDLEPEIQEHVAAGRLPNDLRAVKALLAIPDRDARLKLAARMAYKGVTIKAIVAASTKLAEALTEQAAVQGEPMLARARRRAEREAPASPGASVPQLRESARAMCQACDVRAGQLGDRCGEPAWTLIAHAAQDTCDNCPVRDVKAACDGCPGVELLRRIIAVSSIQQEIRKTTGKK